MVRYRIQEKTMLGLKTAFFKHPFLRTRKCIIKTELRTQLVTYLQIYIDEIMTFICGTLYTLARFLSVASRYPNLLTRCDFKFTDPFFVTI
jgi:hypothetical protein